MGYFDPEYQAEGGSRKDAAAVNAVAYICHLDIYSFVDGLLRPRRQRTNEQTLATSCSPGVSLEPTDTPQVLSRDATLTGWCETLIV